jgi:hypothetical protein
MKYRKHLHEYERQLQKFQSSDDPQVAFTARHEAQQHARQLRQVELKRRNGRPITVEQREKRRRQRFRDLRDEWDKGTYKGLFPTYPTGMSCSIRGGGFFYPYRIVHSSPGRLIIEAEDSRVPDRRTMTFRLLKRRRTSGWFGLWVEEGQSCKKWHKLDKSFHVNVRCDTAQGRFITYFPWGKDWWWNTGEGGSIPCWMSPQVICVYDAPII